MAAVVTKWLSYVTIALLANVFESVRFNVCMAAAAVVVKNVVVEEELGNVLG